jgi:hypothetical protein
MQVKIITQSQLTDPLKMLQGSNTSKDSKKSKFDHEKIKNTLNMGNVC